MQFFEKKVLNFFKIAKGGKYAVECLSIYIISRKCLFHLSSEAFLAKNQKIFNFGRVRKIDEDGILKKKNALILLKCIFTKMGSVGEYAGGTGRLVDPAVNFLGNAANFPRTFQNPRVSLVSCQNRMLGILFFLLTIFFWIFEVFCQNLGSLSWQDAQDFARFLRS